MKSVAAAANTATADTRVAPMASSRMDSQVGSSMEVRKGRWLAFTSLAFSFSNLACWLNARMVLRRRAAASASVRARVRRAGGAHLSPFSVSLKLAKIGDRVTDSRRLMETEVGRI